jgi:hypothetical protein
MSYTFIKEFQPFNNGETVEATDIRFGSGNQETNQPHIDHLIEAEVIQALSAAKAGPAQVEPKPKPEKSK